MLERKTVYMNDHIDNRMGTEGIWKLMLQMAFPSIVAQMINILYSIVDRIYIGHIQGVGASALTGVGVTFSITVFVSAFSMFVGSGGAPLAAIFLGKGDREHAEKILGNGVILLVIFTAINMLFFYLFERPLLMMFGASEVTIPYASEYIRIYLAGTLFVQFSMGLNTFIICQGKAKTAMFSVLIGAILNIILDPIFIFGFGWGVKGAAFASVVSQFFSALYVTGFLCSKRSQLRICIRYFRMEAHITKQIFALGVSPFIMRSTESLISIVMNRGLQIYGGDNYVGALTIMQSVMQLFSAPVGGFTQGVQPVISYNFGAGLFDRVRALYKRMIAVCAIFMCLGTLTTICFPKFYAGFFTNDTELIALVGKVMPVFMFGMLIFGLQNGIQPTFLALGQAKISLFIAVLRKVILLVPLALILPNFCGVMGVYLAEPISDILSATTASILFLLNIKKMLTKEYLSSIR